MERFELMPSEDSQVITYVDPRAFYESAVTAIKAARTRNERRLYIAKLHGVAEPRPEPKPLDPWVVALRDEIERCAHDNWDVRVIERVENQDRLKSVISTTKEFDKCRGYLVKAARGGEGLPFLNVLLVGKGNALLALDDQRYRLARMGLHLIGKPGGVVDAYWNDLWERCPYWIRRASGFAFGPGGIEELEQCFERSPSNPAFVAMWFGDDSSLESRAFMSDLFEDHIKSAVEKAGYRVGRVDLEPHNDFIMDRIIHLVRKAPFVIADFTGHRNGVYFEAGYARALGIEVIHTCRASHFDKAHFDIQQINTLLWDSGEDLESKLQQRILGTLRQGPYDHNS
jgi:hypothetical protein